MNQTDLVEWILERIRPHAHQEGGSESAWRDKCCILRPTLRVIWNRPGETNAKYADSFRALAKVQLGLWATEEEIAAESERFMRKIFFG